MPADLDLEFANSVDKIGANTHFGFDNVNGFKAFENFFPKHFELHLC